MRSNVCASLDAEDKEVALRILNNLGISMSTYVNMAIKQLIRVKGVPFRVVDAEEEAEGEDGKSAESDKETATVGSDSASATADGEEAGRTGENAETATTAGDKAQPVAKPLSPRPPRKPRKPLA